MLILLRMIVSYFSKHEVKSGYSPSYKRKILTRSVSQINVYAVEKVFQQSSRLKVAKAFDSSYFNRLFLYHQILGSI